MIETKIIITSKTISAKNGKEFLKQRLDRYLRKPFEVKEMIQKERKGGYCVNYSSDASILSHL